MDGWIAGSFSGKLPMALSILELEDRPYALNEQFELEVELRNTSDAALVEGDADCLPSNIKVIVL